MRAIVPVMMRWADQDPYRHMNNVQVLRVLEEARVRSLWNLADCRGEVSNIDAELDADSYTVVARHVLDYFRPIKFQCAPLQIELWIGRIGGSSMDVNCEIWSDDSREGRPHVRSKSVVVFLNRDDHRPRRITAGEREQLERYLEPESG